MFILLTHRRDMTEAERRAADRVHARRLLDGTHMVPTQTCIHCGGRALVKEGTLNVAWRHRGITGSAVVPEIAICLCGCQQTTVRRTFDTLGVAWSYGSQDVVFTDKVPYVDRLLPQPITERQRQGLEMYLAKTA